MATPPLIFVLNGPNLNLLGRASRKSTARDTLDDIAAGDDRAGRDLGVSSTSASRTMKAI